MGLSPRVRGNPIVVPPPPSGIRSIPACAGEPLRAWPGYSFLMVYPRVCGGTSPSPPRSLPAKGLSPRVRGNRYSRSLLHDPGGSIPACAGEPKQGGFLMADLSVYPPRVRGHRWWRCFAPDFQGLSPACAGAPLSCCMSSATSRSIPRVCGGTRLRAYAGRRGGGLSPRVRGNLHLPQAIGVRAGSIPACAGEPGPSCAASATERV